MDENNTKGSFQPYGISSLYWKCWLFLFRQPKHGCTLLNKLHYGEEDICGNSFITSTNTELHIIY